jgi:all-trans-retinol 13,14-reductase
MAYEASGKMCPEWIGHFARKFALVSTRHFMNHGQEIYGISTPARFAVRGLGARTPIRRLYLTGKDVSSLGVVGAMYGCVISASVALGKNLLTAVSEPGPRTI